MTALHRHADIPRRRPRQGHRRGEIRRPSSTRPDLAYGSVVTSHDRQGPHRAHRRTPTRCASPACSTCSRTRTGRRMAEHRQRLQGRRGAGRLAVPAALRRQDHVQRPADRAGGRRRRWRPRASRPRWSRVEYDEEAHVTDLYRQRDEACRVGSLEAASALSTRPSRAAMPRRHSPRPRCATTGEYHVPIEHHNPMELYASTVMWDGDGKLTVYDKTQGVQNVQRYLCSVFGLKPDDVRVMSPFVGGAFGSGLRPQYQVVLAVLAARALQALGARRADAPADVRARLSAGDDPADRARRKTPTERSMRSRTRRSR